jgi:hypothetical protein
MSDKQAMSQECQNRNFERGVSRHGSHECAEATRDHPLSGPSGVCLLVVPKSRIDWSKSTRNNSHSNMLVHAGNEYLFVKSVIGSYRLIKKERSLTRFAEGLANSGGELWIVSNVGCASPSLLSPS